MSCNENENNGTFCSIILPCSQLIKLNSCRDRKYLILSAIFHYFIICQFIIAGINPISIIRANHIEVITGGQFVQIRVGVSYSADFKANININFLKKKRIRIDSLAKFNYHSSRYRAELRIDTNGSRRLFKSVIGRSVRCSSSCGCLW